MVNELMARLASVLVLVLLGWAPICAAQADEERGLIDEASSVRLGIERLSDALDELNHRRAALGSELQRLSGVIQKRKQSRPLGGLLPDFELEESLRRSQALSSELEETGRGLDALGEARQKELERLAGMLKRLIELRMEGARIAPAESRGEQVQALLSLKRELEGVRGALNALVPPEYRPAGGIVAAEDPEQLREQADAVRDAQDRLRRELDQIDGRIADAEADVRLDRTLREFLSDQDLFGEDLRTLRASRSISEPAKGGSFSDEQDGAYNTSPGEVPIGGHGGESLISGLTPVGTDKRESSPPQSDPVQQLKSLRQQKQQVIDQLKRLQMEYDRLQERIEHLEK